MDAVSWGVFASDRLWFKVVFLGMSPSGDGGGSDEGLMEYCYVVGNGTEFLEVL